MTGAVQRLDAESVRDAWTRAVERRDTDPEAAVTAARAHLEATCKTILDDHDEGADLPALYKAVQQVLRLSPATQIEDRFRAILGACTTIVKQLGSVRTATPTLTPPAASATGQHRVTPHSPSTWPDQWPYS